MYVHCCCCCFWCIGALWLFRKKTVCGFEAVTLPILLPFFMCVCVCECAAPIIIILLLGCCCFSYKNQLYFLVTVSRYTPKATWLLDLIAIRAQYVHTYTRVDTKIDTNTCNSHFFSFFLSWHSTAFHSIPIPIPFHYNLLWVKCWLHFTNEFHNQKQSTN